MTFKEMLATALYSTISFNLSKTQRSEGYYNGQIEGERTQGTRRACVGTQWGNYRGDLAASPHPQLPPPASCSCLLPFIPETSSVQPASDLIHPHGPESRAGRGCRSQWWGQRVQGWEEHRAARGVARSPGGMCRASLRTAALSSPLC